MGRRKGSLNKNNKNLNIEKNLEVKMTESATLEQLETEIDQKRLELENTKRELEEKKQELKSIPAREVDEKEMIIVKKQAANTVKNKALAEKIEKQKAYDNVMVTGKFINRRYPGSPAKLTYCKYEEDVPKWWTLEDGKVYTLKRGFVDQIKEYYHRPRFIQREGPLNPNAPQSQIQEVDTSHKLYDFVPLNF